jgi:hypothetical protein
VEILIIMVRREYSKSTIGIARVELEYAGRTSESSIWLPIDGSPLSGSIIDDAY